MVLSLYGITLFFAAFLIHLIIWKIHIPRKNPSLVLLIIFFAVFTASLIISQWAHTLTFIPRDIFSQALIFIFFSSMTLAYVVSYSAVEINSPSLEIVLNIAKAGSAGLNENKVKEILTDDKLIKSRLKELAKVGFVCEDKGIYKLSPKGILIADIFALYRRILNAPKGG